MTAYNPTDIHNNLVHENAEEALHYGLIDEATYTRITGACSVTLYTPNYFIGIGLAVLTVIAVLFSCFLLALLLDVSNDIVISTFLFFMAIISYVALELFVNAKKYYNAGIDNVLQVLIVVFLIVACWVVTINNSTMLSTGLCCMVCGWMCYRFVDAFAAMMAYAFFFLYIYFFYSNVTDGALVGVPFVMMAVSALVYFLINRVSMPGKLLYHKYSMECVMLLTVVSFYLSGNYYVISEVNNSSPAYVISGSAVPPSWVFWLFTICTPVGYLLYGIYKKSLLFIRVGILALAATILTIRYYHTIIPADVALMLAGGILIIVSYALIKYLRTSKHGYSFAPQFGDKNLPGAEAVIVAQAFGNTHTAPAHRGTEFGGGRSGGGGATGDF